MGVDLGAVDAAVRGTVVARIRRQELGLMGDVVKVCRNCGYIWARVGIKRAKALAALLD